MQIHLGFATFEIGEISSKELENYFIEFKEYLPNCEFVGCRHEKEENCGIKQAVSQGKIAQKRYERYLKINNELRKREENQW